MNAIVKGKAFKSGNSVAIRLPRSFGVEAGASLVLEQRDGVISVRRAFDQEELAATATGDVRPHHGHLAGGGRSA